MDSSNLPPMKGITFERMRHQLRGELPKLHSIPQSIQAELEAAIDLFALACEQTILGRDYLYNILTDHAFHHSVIALEAALRDRLKASDSVPFKALVKQAGEASLLPNDPVGNQIFNDIVQDRNTIAHGKGERNTQGLFLMLMIATIAHAIAEMYSSRSQD